MGTRHMVVLSRGCQPASPLVVSHCSVLLNKLPRVYDNLATAVDARLRTVEKAPGNQTLDRAAAEAMVERGSVDVLEDLELPSHERRRTFRHDPRLNAPSSVRFSEDQMLAFMRSISAPTLLVQGTTGWPFPEGVFEARVAAVRDSAPVLEVVTVDGSHHLHIDESTADETCGIVRGFLRKHVLSQTRARL